MNAIVMNTLNGAITEHVLPFHSITQDFAGGDSGLYARGGNLDGAAPIAARFATGKTLWGTATRGSLDSAYFSMRGEGEGDFIVVGKATSWTYRFPLRVLGESRAPAGKGIRENYLGFAFQNVGGADFTLDRMEVRAAKSTTRRL